MFQKKDPYLSRTPAAALGSPPFEARIGNQTVGTTRDRHFLGGRLTLWHFYCPRLWGCRLFGFDRRFFGRDLWRRFLFCGFLNRSFFHCRFCLGR